jgi:hypothetical protein
VPFSMNRECHSWGCGDSSGCDSSSGCRDFSGGDSSAGDSSDLSRFVAPMGVRDRRSGVGDRRHTKVAGPAASGASAGDSSDLSRLEWRSEIDVPAWATF